MSNLENKLQECLKSENIKLEDVFMVGADLYLTGSETMIEKAIVRIKDLASDVKLTDKFAVDSNICAVLALA